MPKIPKPDGRHEPTYTRAQHIKRRFASQGRNGNGILTAQRRRELEAMPKSFIDQARAGDYRTVCPTCGLCFLPDTEVLTDTSGNLHHARHLQEEGNA